ncbi:hypothetical protein NDU88_005941 [Pleurodeles waltl]|uniref:Uncharacterized protein n=1 Tax=Pleurodeles waltl TaxID=8319 RepID=A0AAV7UJK6_PLEWA|nr:hypothetical protein NDU88_005941 [Pleurodeles waltl]
MGSAACARRRTAGGTGSRLAFKLWRSRLGNKGCQQKHLRETQTEKSARGACLMERQADEQGVLTAPEQTTRGHAGVNAGPVLRGSDRVGRRPGPPLPSVSELLCVPPLIAGPLGSKMVELETIGRSRCILDLPESWPPEARCPQFVTCVRLPTWRRVVELITGEGAGAPGYRILRLAH